MNVIRIILVLVLLAPTCYAFTITNAGFEAGSFTGWQRTGTPLPYLNGTVWGPPGSYKTNTGAAGGSYWTGTEGAPANWGLAQAIASVPAGAHNYSVGLCSGGRGGSHTQQIRVANGDVTGSFNSGTGTQVASHTMWTSGWLSLGGNFTASGSTVTVILWAQNTSTDGWGGNGANWYDGLTIDNVTPIQDWALY